jgi:alpha-amylase
VALQMTSLGIPTIYYGEEVGREGSVWPVNRSDMPWGARPVQPGKGIERDEALREFYRTLIAARRANPALSIGTFKRLSSDGDLLVFERSDAASGNAVVVAVNRGAAEAAVTVPAPAAWQGSTVKDAITGAAASVADGQLAVTVPARQARVYVAAAGG